MTQKIVVEAESAVNACQELEKGNILYFPTTPFAFPQEEIDFLLKQKQSAAKGRKNIAYKPQSGRLTNHDAGDPVSAERLKEILRRYSERSERFLKELLPSYAPHWSVDYTSFRPFQEKGRPLRLRARNDLLHVDAFPTRPLHGQRILRFFTNINPSMSRNWITSDPMPVLAERFGGKGVPFPYPPSPFATRVKRLLNRCGLKLPLRSPYDTFMLDLHNFLKENGHFQKLCRKDAWEFPPNCCWAVFTDQVSHAALSGQYALEQTFLVPVEALLAPEQSPLRILEKLAGRKMV